MEEGRDFLQYIPDQLCWHQIFRFRISISSVGSKKTGLWKQAGLYYQKL